MFTVTEKMWNDLQKRVEALENAPRPAKIRGSHIPLDWQPSDALKQELRAKYPNVKLGTILEEFVDFWASVPGQRGSKLDWNRTFRNRVREVAHLPRFQRNGVVATVDASIEDLRARGARLAARAGDGDA